MIEVLSGLSKNVSNLVLHLTRNQTGRDFVVGDIHGHFELFDLLLKDIAFNPKIDRIISVGDTIDRGPESERALSFWKQPWFYMVRGNHEAMLAGTVGANPNMYGLWMQNGGEWSSDTPDALLREMADFYEHSPYAIMIDTAHGDVGVVHADMPDHRSWSKLVKSLEKKKATARDLKSLLWSRETYRAYRMNLEYGGAFTEPTVEGVHKIYVGHSIVRNPVIFGNTVFIDTGAYCNGKLTAVDLATEDVIIVQPRTDEYESF